MAETREIAESLCASFTCARGFSTPFSYFCAQHLFPAKTIEALKALPFTPQATASGRRETAQQRLYFDRERLLENRLLRDVAEAFQAPQVTSALSGLCAAPLHGTFLRIEYAIDQNGFWLEPHTDLGVKKFTGLIALSGGCDDAEGDLGTDLYASADEHAARAPFESNAGVLFVPGPATWHGFAPRPINGLRKSLIVNYVGPEWQSRDQLAFPDRAVTF